MFILFRSCCRFITLFLFMMCIDSHCMDSNEQATLRQFGGLWMAVLRRNQQPHLRNNHESQAAAVKKRRNSGSSEAESSPTKAAGSPEKRAKRDTSEHPDTSNCESLLVHVLPKGNMIAVDYEKCLCAGLRTAMWCCAELFLRVDTLQSFPMQYLLVCVLEM